MRPRHLQMENGVWHLWRVGARVRNKGRLCPHHENPNAQLESWDILAVVGSQRRCWSEGTAGLKL